MLIFKSPFLKYSVLFIFLVSVFSCNQNRVERHTGTYSPIVVESKGYLLPEDSVALPKIISVDENKLKKVPAGKPEMIPLQYLKDSDGIVMRNKKGEPFILGQFGGYTPVKNINSDDGLPTNTIHKMLIDNLGQLWIASTGAGICCFDGRAFLTLTMENGLGNNIVFDLAKDKKGNIWIATDGGGMNCYNGRSLTSYTTTQGMRSNYLRCVLVDDKGNVWCGTKDAGISCFNGKTFKNYSVEDGLPDNHITDILQDRNGDLWFAAANGGISRFDGRSFKNYGVSQGLLANYVNCISEDETGRIWLGTSEGAICFDGRSFYNFNKPSGLANIPVYDIQKDKSGNLWFATSEGVSWIDHLDTRAKNINEITFRSITQKQGLTGVQMRSIVQDAGGNMWFGSEGSGLNCFPGGAYIAYDPYLGLPNANIITILTDSKGGVWAGYYRAGLVYFNGNAFYKYTTKQGLPDNTISCIYEDKKGGLWVGTDGSGLSYFNGKTFTTYSVKNGLPENTVFSILEDAKGNLWLGTRGGVSCFTGKKFINYSTKNGLVNNNVLSMLEDKSGGLWMTTNEGASYFDGKGFVNFTIQNGLAHNVVFSAAIDSTGNIWFGTAKGLSCLTVKSGFKKFTNFTTANGLPDNFVTQVLHASNGKIVVGTNNGLTYFDPKTTLQNGIGLMDREIFNTSTGYPIKDINVGTQCMRFDKKGVLWAGIGDKNSLIRFDYNAVNGSPTPPAPIIKSIKINGSKIPWYSLVNDIQTDSTTRAQQETLTYRKALSKTERDSIQKLYSTIRFDTITAFQPLPVNLRLPYEFNNIEIEFVATILDKAMNGGYQYMLDGFDNNWSSISTNTSANLDNLREGTYTLRVRAVNKDGHPGIESNYTFTILPPWWRTWWFRTLGALAFLITVFFIARFIYNYQFHKQKLVLEKQLAIQYERQRISSDLHDEIGSTLSSINIYAGLAKKEADKTLFLESINQNVNDVVNKLDDLVWSINPQYDTILSIINRLQSYAGPIAQASGILFGIKNELPEADIKLSAEIKHTIFLTAKELINNAIKHAQCKQITVQFLLLQKKLILVVKDDGKGFDLKSVRKDRNGLVNIAQRVAAIRGSLATESGAGNGTQTTITIPV